MDIGRREIERPGMQEWFILFGDTMPARRPWWHHLLAPGYRHVIAMRAVTNLQTLAVEHVGTRMVVELWPWQVEETVLRYLEMGQAQHALRIGVPGPDDVTSFPVLRPPMTCVEAVKAVLGLRAPLILFPQQLARRLRAMGALDIPVFPIPSAA